MKKIIFIILIFIVITIITFLYFGRNNPFSIKDKKIIEVAENYLKETDNDFAHEKGVVTYLADNKAQVDFSEPVPKGANLRPAFRIVKVDLATMKAYSIEKK